ncbi:MAG: hypothetical protein R3183_13670 [Oleiphilaceae bacterium]|nr:hypothetical protein [Oleiphilaceae bacterium]
MRGLAEFIMRGPRQAAFVAMLFTAIPMLFWLGAAVVALVTLRLGLERGLAVLVWAIIPALGWWLGLQDPGAVIVLVSTLVMAMVLRTTVSWNKTLVTGAVIGIGLGALAPLLMSGLIDTLMQMADQIFRELAKNAETEYDQTTQDAFRVMMIASFAASFFAMSMTALFIARSWQSHLYNPGGWKQEFHHLRLQPLTVMGWLVAAMAARYVGVEPVVVLLVGWVAVVACGFALVHGLIAKKQLGGQWLFGFYFLVVMLFPTVLMLLTCLVIVDSLIDIRSRVKPSPNVTQ